MSGVMGGFHKGAFSAITLLLLISVLYDAVPLTAFDDLADREILVEPASIELDIGETATLSVTIVIVHANCPIDIDDTRITVPSLLRIVDSSDWDRLSSTRYVKTLALEGTHEGAGHITIIRDCPRYGIITKEVPCAVGGVPLPQDGTVDVVFEYSWSSLRSMTISEASTYYGVPTDDMVAAFGGDIEPSTTFYQLWRSYGIDKHVIKETLESLFYEAHASSDDASTSTTFDLSFYTRDVVFLLLLLASVLLFLKGYYRARYVTLAASLVYFGFYLEGCMCHLGAIAQLFIVDVIPLHWVVLVIVPIVASLVMGRIFCGWVCFFGAIQKFLYDAGSRVFKVHTRRKLPRQAYYVKFLVLGIMFAYALAYSRAVFCEYDPFYFIFARTFQWGLLGALTVMLVVSSLLVERGFCRIACPLGALLWITERISILNVRVRNDACTKCTLCNRVCPMGRDLVSGSGECIACGKCLVACRKDALYYGKKE